MSFNVYVTRQIHEEGINLLKKFCQTVEVNPYDRPLTYDELLRQVNGSDAILTMLSDRIDERVINEAKSIKVIANYAVGYENIDIKTAPATSVILPNRRPTLRLQSVYFSRHSPMLLRQLSPRVPY